VAPQGLCRLPGLFLLARLLGGAEQVYRYLGRYTHRVAISNARLVSLEDGQVRFRYKDYAGGSTWKVMQLAAEEFLRRFLLHVLPKRFVRIRHYGLLAGRNVPTRLAQCRELLQPSTAEPESVPQLPRTQDLAVPEPDLLLCPHCGHPLTRSPLGAEPDAAPHQAGSVPQLAVIDSS